MTLFCDESGSLSAGAMTFALVDATADMADAVVGRFRSVAGLRGELKGSRINLVERAYVLELLAAAGGRAVVTVARRGDYPRKMGSPLPEDRRVYEQLLDDGVRAWMERGVRVDDVVIDAGRYDDGILSQVQRGVTRLIGGGQVRTMDSYRSAGVQLADVIANSVYNLAIDTPRTARLTEVVAPFRRSGMLDIRLIPALAAAG